MFGVGFRDWRRSEEIKKPQAVTADDSQTGGRETL